MSAVIGPILMLIAIGILGYARLRPTLARSDFLDFIIIPCVVLALTAFGGAFTITAFSG